MGWLPGAIIFPLLICTIGGNHQAESIWLQFILSFLVSALLTTAQTFFLLEWFLIRYFYADFFQDARPAAVRGRHPHPLLLAAHHALEPRWRPPLPLLLVTVNIRPEATDTETLKDLAVRVAVVGGISGGFIFLLVGSDLSKWVGAHAMATEQVELENYEIHIQERRPDEWGQLTDRFNDMAAALGRARQLRETFGQFVNPAVRDHVMETDHDLGGELKEITVLFADIRGFTRRTTGEHPEKVVELLNRFLTLATITIESKGGIIDKFIGDGVMAHFGALRRQANHADQAVSGARELLVQLKVLNAELVAKGKQPLQVGIGIHTGVALVGSIGSKEKLADGRERLRRAFTAIGETVNLGQRMEMLTKKFEGPILISEQTRLKLQSPIHLHCYGPVAVPGYDGTLGGPPGEGPVRSETSVIAQWTSFHPEPTATAAVISPLARSSSRRMNRLTRSLTATAEQHSPLARSC